MKTELAQIIINENKPWVHFADLNLFCSSAGEGMSKPFPRFTHMSLISDGIPISLSANLTRSKHTKFSSSDSESRTEKETQRQRRIRVYSFGFRVSEPVILPRFSHFNISITTSFSRKNIKFSYITLLSLCPDLPLGCFEHSK